jgi:hypothetical protein
VLGIRVRFESDDERPSEIAEEAFGAWRSLEARPDLIDEHPVIVRVFVDPGHEGDEGHAPIEYHVTQPGHLIIRSPGSRAVSDVARREAEIRVSQALLQDRQHFRYGMLESALLFLLSYLDRQPVHAAVGRAPAPGCCSPARAARGKAPSPARLRPGSAAASSPRTWCRYNCGRRSASGACPVSCIWRPAP